MAGRQVCTVLPVRLGDKEDRSWGTRGGSVGRVGLSGNTTRDVEIRPGNVPYIYYPARRQVWAHVPVTAEHRHTCTPSLTNDCSLPQPKSWHMSIFLPGESEEQPTEFQVQLNIICKFCFQKSTHSTPTFKHLGCVRHSNMQGHSTIHKPSTPKQIEAPMLMQITNRLAKQARWGGHVDSWRLTLS